MVYLLAFLDRLRKKLTSIAPVVLAGVVVFGIAWVVLYFVTPLLPDASNVPSRKARISS